MWALGAWVLALTLLTAGAEASGWERATASWYGPGLYGNETACGQTLTRSTWGTAHRSLDCGTTVTFRYRGRVVPAPVVDRGPFVGGRSFDLTGPVKSALGCPDICRLEYRVGSVTASAEGSENRGDTASPRPSVARPPAARSTPRPAARPDRSLPPTDTQP